MFKPLQGVNGLLVQPLGAGDGVVYVDSQLATTIALELGVGGYTYMLIEQGNIVEAVKVMGFTPYSLIIERGKDGSLPRTFLSGAVIRYILTAEAVGEIAQEKINALAPEETLVFNINAPHTVNRVDNIVTIEIQSTNISSPDGSIDVTGSGLDIGVSIQRGAFGCCD